MTEAEGRSPSSAPAPGPSSVAARPPRGPLLAIAVVAALTAPLALMAVALGDAVLGVVAALSAGWAGSLAFLGWTASAEATTERITVRWMRSTSTAAWAQVVAVEVDDGAGWGSGRGALLRLDDGTTLRWTPWLPVLWFATRSARASVAGLVELASVVADRDGREIDVHVTSRAARGR